MTVAQDLNFVAHTGNGITTLFPFTFKTQNADQLQVYLYTITTGAAVLLSPTAYIVKAELPGTGNILYNPSGVPLDALHKLLIFRVVPILQELDIQNQGGFHPETLEEQLDRTIMAVQQLREQVSRALQVDVGNIPPSITQLLIDIAATFVASAQAIAARDLAQQYAADAAMVSGVNVPIYASRTSASGATIAAGVKNIHAQYYNPSYTVLNTLNGGADYARMSKADIDTLTLPAAGYFRSIDRFMPDGSTDATNGGYWIISSEILSPQMFGARGDGVTVDTTALQAAVTFGSLLKRSVFVPGATFLTRPLTLSNNTHIYGTLGTAFAAQIEDEGIFVSTVKTNIHIHNLALFGANGSDHSALCAALNFNRTSNVHVHDVLMSNWPDRCILYQGNTATEEVAKNAVFERCQMSGGQAPMRFSGSAIYLGAHTENVTVQDCDMEDYNGGVFSIDPLGVGKTHVRGHKILNNRIRRMQQYGIISYLPGKITNITGAADNGSGDIRLTAALHGCATGDQVRVEAVVGTTEANGSWLITVIDANTFDLDDSVFVNAYVSGGTTLAVNPCDIEIAGNIIEDIDGTPTAINGMNGAFGAGIYCVGGCGINLHDNIIRRSNQGTTATTLAPGGIGCAGVMDDLRISNNIVEDCFWHGIYVPSSPYGKTQIIGNKVRRCHKIGIYAQDSNFVSIIGNDVEGHRSIAASQGIAVLTNSNIKGIVVNNNNVVCFAASPIFSIDNAHDFVIVGNVFINEGPASLFTRVGQFTDCDNGIVSGNIFDGKLLTNNALYISAMTNTDFSSNRAFMTDSGAVNACVRMLGTCTGTVYHRNNSNSIDRMENTSTGGIMHTKSTVNTSGGKTRQIGDTIENTVPAAAGVALWGKSAASAGGLNWETVSYA